MAQRFWNGDMGEAFTAPGAHLGRDELEQLVDTYPQGPSSGPCFVGVDVGAVLHLVVGEETKGGVMRVIWLGTLPGQSAAEVRAYVRERWPNYRGAVIDALPETRFARRLAFASRRWLMCLYGGGRRDMVDQKSRTVTVDRTATLDAVAEAVRLGKDRLLLPADALGVSEFVEHMGAITRVFDPEARGGEGAYVWQGDGADHYFHALGYMMLARRLVVRR